MKICSRCKKEKNFDEFNKSSQARDGLKYICRECQKIDGKKYREKHSDKLKLKKEKYKKRKNFLNRQKWLNDSVWREKQKEKAKVRKKKYLSTENGKKHKSIWDKNYREKHREQINEKRRHNIKLKLENNIRCRFRKYVKRNIINNIKSVSKKSKELLGCSLDEYKKYLENLFEEEMSWENYGEWHIDHVKPISSFDLTKEDEVKAAFHYSNTQPLWKLDNLRKGSK